MAASAPRVVIYGGSGALGSVLVKHFKAEQWWVASIGHTHTNEEADCNIVVGGSAGSLVEQEAEVESQLTQILDDSKLDAILCVAGGWAGGSAKAKKFVENSELMCKQSIWSSVIASRIAAKHMKEGGVLVLTGAQAALNGTPGMIGYGMAKACVHQLVRSLAEQKSGMPADSCVAAILPATMDTPMNRKFMPNADQSSWTSLEFVSELLFKWSNNTERPESGSLVQLITKEGQTSLENAK